MWRKTINCNQHQNVSIVPQLCQIAQPAKILNLHLVIIECYLGHIYENTVRWQFIKASKCISSDRMLRWLKNNSS